MSDPRPITEIQLHMHVAHLLRTSAAPGVIFFHPANGELRDKATAHKLQQMGVRPGVADLCIIVPLDGMKHTTNFLELKAAKGVLSPAQLVFAENCAALGLAYEVARSPEQALTILLDWRAIVPSAAFGLMSAGKAKSKTKAEAA